MAGTFVTGVDITIAALTLAYIGKLLFQTYLIGSFGSNQLQADGPSVCHFDIGKASLSRQSVARKIRL